MELCSGGACTMRLRTPYSTEALVTGIYVGCLCTIRQHY